MKLLLQTLEHLQNTEVKTVIHQRIQEFKHINTRSTDDLFKELSFCILTANFNAQRAIQIHAQLNTCFSSTTQETLAKKLKRCGYRFPATRAAFIVRATQQKQKILEALHTLSGEQLREWLVQNIDGLGYKEASHFLRNIGYDDYAIIDSHILDLLKRHHLLQPPRTLTRKKYLEIETLLRTIATQAHLTLAELDLYLWFLETGMVLK